MSRTKRHDGETAQDEHKQRRKNKYKPKKDNRYRGTERYTNEELRKEHIYIPPETSGQVETYDPDRPFPLSPFQARGLVVGDEKNTCSDHGSPIIITISSKGKTPIACGIFCNINSIYNTTFMLHDDKLDRREADLHASIAALQQARTFIATNTKRNSLQTRHITQIIIKTSSAWLGQGFAGSTAHYRYDKLSLEFDKLVDEIGEYNGVRPLVKF